jgi:ABC-2 type transport system permease protein
MISVEWISSLSHVLAQPIYRDALLYGKFLAGLATFSIGHEGPWAKVASLAQYLLVRLGRIAVVSI